jgi:hypothetical protein
MCCGRFNQQMIRAPRPALEAPAGTPNVRPSTMSQTSHPQFEYVGKTALTVVSPLTRRQYRFERPGARLEADVRDCAWLTFVPNLQRVS